MRRARKSGDLRLPPPGQAASSVPDRASDGAFGGAFCEASRRHPQVMEEPARKSFLDVSRYNRSFADRGAPTTRFVYIGAYKGTPADVQKFMEERVRLINEEYGSGIVLSGLLLVYPNVCLHLLEATHELLSKHLKDVFLDDEQRMLGRAVALPPCHNLYKVYFTEWHAAFVPNPPSLLDEIVQSDMDEVQKQVRDCLRKIYSLGEYLMNLRRRSGEHPKETLKNLEIRKPCSLPEVTIVEYLLTVETPVLRDIRNYMGMFTGVPFIELHNGNCDSCVRKREQ